MTATGMTLAINNGWNVAVETLNECKDDDAKKDKIKELMKKVNEVQTKYNSTQAIFHYAEGVRYAIVEFETTGVVPSEA